MALSRQLLKTTAVRLTLLYSVVFGLLAVGVVFYISFNTGRLLIQQFQISVDEEVQQIASFTRSGGVRRLIPLIESRSRRPGANLYLVADINGRIIAGNVRDIDRRLLVDDGWKLPPFAYDRFDDDDRSSRAVARVFTLPGNLRLLVGRDIGEAEQFRSIVLQASTISLGVMVLTGLILWFLVGRRALRHIDSVAKSSRRIIAGDLSQRLPLSGSGDEFDRLSNSLNAMIERVETLNTGVRQMSDSIAHDLRTPLTRLRNRAEAALNSSNKETLEKTVQHIVDDADAMMRTFDALLLISQAEAEVRAVELQPIAADQVINNVFELFEPLAEERGVDLSVQIDGQPVFQGHRELAMQALTNMIDNALKYGSTGVPPALTIGTTIRDDHVVLWVADNGAGIAVQERESVKERFVRLDKSRTEKGAGLGLALVDAIAKLHNGQLALEDNGPGLRCELLLPIHVQTPK